LPYCELSCLKLAALESASYNDILCQSSLTAFVAHRWR